MYRRYVMFLVLFFFCTSAMAQPVAERSLLVLGYTPGFPVYVSISVTNNNEDISMRETIPVNWEINEIITENGSVSNGVITWSLSKNINQKKILLRTSSP